MKKIQNRTSGSMRRDSSCRGGGCAASCKHPTCAWLPGQGWCSRSAGPSMSHQLVLTWCNAKPYGYRTSRQRIKKAVSPQGENPYRKEHLEKATLSTTQATRKHTFTALHHTTGNAVPTYTQIAPFPKRPHTNLSGKCWTLETCMASVNIFLQKGKTKSSPSSEHRWVLLRAGNVTVECYGERAS